MNGDTVVKAVWKKIPVDNPNGGSNNNGDGATKASKSRNSGKLPKTGYAGMPYQVAAMILIAGGLLIAGSKKTRKHSNGSSELSVGAPVMGGSWG